MKTPRKIFTITFVLWLGIVSFAWGKEQNLAGLLIQAQMNHQPIPVLSVHEPAMDEKMAYNIQKTFIERLLSNEKPAGFKAGLTSKGWQKRFGLSAPVAGVLFESGKINNKASIDRAEFHQLMLETEIGLVLGSSISEPVSDPAALRKSIQAVVPVIELPDLGFADMANLKGVDIIAANVSARKFILGRPLSPGDIDINAVMVTLSLNGLEIGSGKGTDAYGDQWQAGLWLVNKMIEQGWKLEAGQVLLTGALGRMLPGKPGKHLADYGDLGKIEFEVR